MTDKIVVKATPMIPWFQQKTTWTAITGVVAAIAGYFTNEISLVAMIYSVFGGLTVIFGRQGIEKAKNPTLMSLADRGEEIKNG